MKKKNRCIYFLFFHWLEQMKRKKKNNEKKKLVQNLLGYCPNCIARFDYIVRGEIVSQYRYCIVTGTARLEAESVL